jgi:ATP-dependent DNA helicase RecG
VTLEDRIEEIFRLSLRQKRALSKLGINKIIDLLYHFPTRYEIPKESKNIIELKAGDQVSIFGTITKLKTSKGFKTKIPMAEGILEDHTGKIKIIWFNQPYLAKMLKEGMTVLASGRISIRRKNGEIYMSNPKIELAKNAPSFAEPLFAKTQHEEVLFYPIYPETQGITSNWFLHAIRKILKSETFEKIQDPIPEEILKKYHLPNIATAFLWIHSPKKLSLAEVAKKRFAFEEIFFIQLQRQKIRKMFSEKKSPKIIAPKDKLELFTSRFPFQATKAQERAIDDILSDMQKDQPMARLLEGDVGSGKTYVAAVVSYATVITKPIGKNFGSLQVAYMAPTEILASQHFESFISYFNHMPINIALITGKECRKFPSKINAKNWTDISRNQLLKWVSNGEISIVIGTHTLIQKSVKFKNLGLVIIDEQHRFGTNQRQSLARKDDLYPHLLSMTATPIPRTLALTIFGDLDITLLDEMPHGRKPVITEIVPKETREEVYKKIRQELKQGRQAYVICPRIELPDEVKETTLMAKSVKEEAQKLQKYFTEFKVGILHGKMKPKEKEETMKEFEIGKIHILVATSVVEVGINVPNATVILIEGAERFGLAQLHQLRGRVQRSGYQAYCFLITESFSRKIFTRLNAIKTARNGFELAEKDLELRGAGELYGRKQWGLTDIGMEGIKNIKMVEAARAEATQIIEKDEYITKFPVLADEMKKREKEEIHFE